MEIKENSWKLGKTSGKCRKNNSKQKKKNLSNSFAFRVSVLFLFSLCFQGWPGLAWVCMCVFISAVFFRFWFVAWLVGLLVLSHVGMQRAKAPVSSSDIAKPRAATSSSYVVLASGMDLPFNQPISARICMINRYYIDQVCDMGCTCPASPPAIHKRKHVAKSNS